MVQTPVRLMVEDMHRLHEAPGSWPHLRHVVPWKHIRRDGAARLAPVERALDLQHAGTVNWTIIRGHCGS